MLKFIVFRLGTEDYGIGIKSVVEILKSQEICSLPDLPPFISGVITVRGDVFPLVDLRKRFNMEPQPKNERVIIIRVDFDKLGLIVDEVREIAAFEDSEIMKPPQIFKGLKTEYLQGLAKKKGRVVILLDIKRILSAEEMSILKETKEIIKAVE